MQVAGRGGVGTRVQIGCHTITRVQWRLLASLGVILSCLIYFVMTAAFKVAEAFSCQCGQLKPAPLLLSAGRDILGKT